MPSRNGSKPATQGDLEALRSSLGGKIDGVEARLDKKIDENTKRLALEIVKTQADVHDIKESMATKADVTRILSAIDSFAGKVKNSESAMIIHGHALVEIEVKLKDHDKRLVSLESRK